MQKFCSAEASQQAHQKASQQGDLMHQRSVVIGIATSVMLMGAATSAHAWGARGHRIVAAVGSTLAPSAPFWTSNVDSMKQLCTVPDRVWKTPSTKSGEAPNHWFQADAYVKDGAWTEIANFPSSYAGAVQQYGEDTVVKNGTAPWRVRQLYSMAVSAFRSGDFKAGLEYAGTMSHYIGDLSQPLHDSVNYDGQETGNKGIHKFFETDNITNETEILSEVQARAERLLNDRNFTAQVSKNLMASLLNEIARSVALRDEVLNNDISMGRQSSRSKQLDLAEDRMADGAATLALILAQISRDAGLSQNTTAVPVDDPSWIETDFANQSRLRAYANTSASFEISGRNAIDLLDGDDCSAE